MCGPDCPGTYYIDQDSLKFLEACLCLSSTGIKGVHQHVQLKKKNLKKRMFSARPSHQPRATQLRLQDWELDLVSFGSTGVFCARVLVSFW